MSARDYYSGGGGQYQGAPQGGYYPQQPQQAYQPQPYGNQPYQGQPPPQTVYVQQPQQKSGGSGTCMACLAGICLCCCAEELCECLF